MDTRRRDTMMTITMEMDMGKRNIITTTITTVDKKYT